jgi:hypothetical protein
MTTGTATTGRIRRAARRGLAALALVWVDPGGSVTFTNRIAPETVQVGGGGLLPSLVTVQVFTDVTLGLPSGSTPLARDASVTERFDSTCPPARSPTPTAWSSRTPRSPAASSRPSPPGH